MSLAEGRAPRRTAGNRLSGLLEAEEEDEFYQTTYGGFTEVCAGGGPGGALREGLWGAVRGRAGLKGGWGGDPGPEGGTKGREGPGGPQGSPEEKKGLYGVVRGAEGV